MANKIHIDKSSYTYKYMAYTSRMTLNVIEICLGSYECLAKIQGLFVTR